MKAAILIMACVAGLHARSVCAASVVPGCLPQVSVPLRVHIGDAGPRAALLEGGIETPLSLFEAGSRQLLWSAGAQSSAIQVFAGMDAAFTGSIAAVDLDGDGLHDRLYAGDMSARLWRFDLGHGADASRWAVGGIYADFSNTEGRSFLAAPDISLSAPVAESAWINIAIGTAAPGNAAANNRFYALRDHAVHGAWGSSEYENWQPLREEDLLLVQPVVQDMAQAAAIDTAGPGWYVELGTGHVITPAITVTDRAVLAIAAAVPRSGACEVFARIASFDLAQARVVPAATPGTWSTTLAGAIPPTARFGFGVTAGGIAPCLLAGQRITACDVDTRPRKTWWRRIDAE